MKSRLESQVKSESYKLTARVLKKISLAISGIKHSYDTWQHRSQLPSISFEDDLIVQALEYEGVYLTHIDSLGIAGSKKMMELALSISSEIKSAVADSHSKSYVAHASADMLLREPALILWGLNHRILSIVESYIKLPVAYRGLTLRRDEADGVLAETRLWHKDGEDRRIIKIIIYLNDVTVDDGPFEYIPKYLTPPKNKIKFQKDGRVLDADMSNLIPPKNWKPWLVP